MIIIMYLDLTTAAILSEKNCPPSGRKLFETTYDESIVLFKVLNNIFEFKNNGIWYHASSTPDITERISEEEFHIWILSVYIRDLESKENTQRMHDYRLAMNGKRTITPTEIRIRGIYQEHWSDYVTMLKDIKNWDCIMKELWLISKFK